MLNLYNIQNFCKVWIYIKNHNVYTYVGGRNWKTTILSIRIIDITSILINRYY